MSNILESIDGIRSINNYYNNQINNNLKTLQDEINQLIYKTQSDLLQQISHDYNISSKELNKKYLIKTKKTQGRKPKEEYANDSPTMQQINDINMCDSDDENIVNLIIKQSSSQDIHITDDLTNSKTSQVSDVFIKTPNTEKTGELLFKTIKIKKESYLLNLQTDEIYDMENNLVGIKKNNKYMLKKNSDQLDKSS